MKIKDPALVDRTLIQLMPADIPVAARIVSQYKKPDERHFTTGKTKLVHLTGAISSKLHRALLTYAYQFQREFSYDFPGYGEGDTKRPDAKIYAITSDRIVIEHRTKDYCLDFLPALAGIVCFRLRTYQCGTKRWMLQFTYLHPWFRGDGLMTRAVADLKQDIGPFGVEGPISKGMRRVMEKTGVQE